MTPALQRHRQRRQGQDRNWVMTMVLKECSPFHRSRERCEGGVFAIDRMTDECTGYEPVDSEKGTTITRINISPLLSKSATTTTGHSTGLDIRYDLMDCQIDICSAAVLALYTENFDWQDSRRDFLKGVLTSEILGVRVATHIVGQHGYVGRVRSPHLYDSISRDIIERWAFPIVPEADLLEEEQLYTHSRGHIYVGPRVVLSRSARLERNVVLGAGVTVGEHTVIRNSILGPRCQIGSDVLIENAYIWEGTIVESGCRLHSCILADGVRVRGATIVSAGSLVAANTTIGPRIHLPPHTRVAKLGEHIDVALRHLSIGDRTGVDGKDANISGTTADNRNETPDDAIMMEGPPAVLGEASDGVIWEGSIGIHEGVGDADIDSQDEDPIIQAERRDAFEMGSSFHSSRPHFRDLTSDGDSDSDDGMEDGSKLISTAMDESVNSYGRNVAKFMREGLDLVRHAIQTNYLLDNALLELNSLKFSCNATFSECRHVIIAALLDYLLSPSTSATTPTAPSSEEQQALVRKWAPLLARFTQGHEEQLQLIDGIQGACAERPGLERAFRNIIPMLFKEDVLEEEAIVQWLKVNEISQPNSIYVRQIRPFVEWLQQYDDEDETGDETDEEDEDD